MVQQMMLKLLHHTNTTIGFGFGILESRVVGKPFGAIYTFATNLSCLKFSKKNARFSFKPYWKK
jgi:hypothetical protein